LIPTLTELEYFPSDVTSPAIFSMFSLGILTLWNMANLFKQINKQCKIYFNLVWGVYITEKRSQTDMLAQWFQAYQWTENSALQAR